jgi:hypothetical protein
LTVLGCWQVVAVVLGFFYYELVLEPPNNSLHHSSFSVYKYLLSATLFFFPFSFSQFAFMSYVSSMLVSQLSLPPPIIASGNATAPQH